MPIKPILMMAVFVGMTVFFGLFLCFFLYSLGQGIPNTDELHISGLFLKKSGTWSGEFTNFVNQKGGIIQRGRIRLKTKVSSEGIIEQRIAILKPDGTASDYKGYATLKAEGNRLIWVGPVSEDDNTGNPIENHRFEGYIGSNHIYIVEEYVEVYPDNRREKRKNNVHYVILSPEKIIWLADIHVNDQLLVFANTLLEHENEISEEKILTSFLR
jgi:hypothetical protein